MANDKDGVFGEYANNYKKHQEAEQQSESLSKQLTAITNLRKNNNDVISSHAIEILEIGTSIDENSALKRRLLEDKNKLEDEITKVLSTHLKCLKVWHLIDNRPLIFELEEGKKPPNIYGESEKPLLKIYWNDTKESVK